MPRPTLHALAADIDRLLAAGAAAAAGDAGLRRRESELKALAAKVPALAPIAAAVGRATDSDASVAARALLGLLAVVQQARASLATSGVEGPIEPIGPSGPWASPAPAGRLREAALALARTGARRLEAVQEGLGSPPAADLRLVGPLLCALGDRYGELADWVARHALPAFAPAIVEELRRGLNLKGSAADGRRLAALCAIDPAGSRELGLQALRDGNAIVRLAALESLPAVAPEAVEGVAVGLLRGKAAGAIRVAAVKALGRCRAASGDALDVLIAALRDFDYSTHTAAVDALSAIREPAVGRVAAALTDPDESVRIRSTWVLNRMGSTAAPAVPDLIASMYDPAKWMRRNSLAALGKIGPEAQMALPAVVEAMEDAEPETWIAAALASVQIGGDAAPAVARLANGLRRGVGTHSMRDAALALQEIGPSAEAAVPDLIATLANPGSYCRHFAARALGAIGPAAIGSVPALAGALADHRYFVREAAASVLGQFGPAAAAAIPALTEQLTAEPSKPIRDVIARALESIRDRGTSS